MTPEVSQFPTDQIEQYSRLSFWGDQSVADLVYRNAMNKPHDCAFVGRDMQISWRQYDERSSQMALALKRLNFEPSDRIAFYLPDGPTVHVVMLAIEKAGCIAVGISPMSGSAEVEHLLKATAAKAIITPFRYRDRNYGALFQQLVKTVPSLHSHLTVGPGSRGSEGSSLDKLADDIVLSPAGLATIADDKLGPNDVFLLNSTSGTTGQPKCVQHTQNRWMHVSRLAQESAEMTGDDIFMSVVPAPFGFGLWTAHFCPTMLGCTTVIMNDWDPSLAVDLIERQGVTVFAGVTTQLVMMLERGDMDRHDLESLRVVYTGGEAVPYERSLEFETVADCAVLQFYGSNECGVLSHTALSDAADDRLRTAGHIIPEMNVRIFDPASGNEIEDRPATGQPGCRGPTMSPGYYNDAEANRELYRDDGWMLMPDMVTVDGVGRLKVVGRLADIIIRGGKNISASYVEEELSAHPNIAMAAVVGMPDPTFGERVCAFIVTREDGTFTIDDLRSFLANKGVAKSSWPERIELLRQLPISAGGKIAKAELRASIRQKIETEFMD